MAMSWLDRYVESSSSDVIAVFVRWGSGSAYAPSFSITGIDPPDSQGYSQSISITGSISVPSGEDVTILALFDGDYWDIKQFTPSISGSSYSFSVDLSSLMLAAEHVMTFYALTSLGTFAPNPPSISMRYASLTVYYSVMPDATVPCTRTPTVVAAAAATSGGSGGGDPVGGGQATREPFDDEVPAVVIIVAAVGGAVVLLATVGCVLCAVKPCSNRAPKVEDPADPEDPEPPADQQQQQPPFEGPPPSSVPGAYGSAAPAYADPQFYAAMPPGSQPFNPGFSPPPY
jgi:hypothetical protein